MASDRKASIVRRSRITPESRWQVRPRQPKSLCTQPTLSTWGRITAEGSQQRLGSVPPGEPSPPPSRTAYPYYAPLPLPPPLPHTTWLVIPIAVFVTLILASGLLMAVPFLRVAGAPDVKISHFQLYDVRSCVQGAGGKVYANFDLVNSGGNGFARIEFDIDGVADHQTQYYVHRGSALHVQEGVYIPDCGPHAIGAGVTSEWAG